MFFLLQSSRSLIVKTPDLALPRDKRLNTSKISSPIALLTLFWWFRAITITAACLVFYLLIWVLVGIDFPINMGYRIDGHIPSNFNLLIVLSPRIV